MKHVFLFFLVLGLLFCSSAAYSLDIGIDTHREKRIDREKSLSTKDTEEQRTSSGTKNASTTTTGTDQNDQQIIKHIGQRMRNSNLDVTLSLGKVFLESLAMLEPSEPILKARLLTKPRQPADFGISAEIQPGVINTIKADLLNKAASSNSPVSSVGSNGRLRLFRDSLALYGIIVAQAYLNLSSDLAILDAGATRDKKGNIAVKNLGYDDFFILVDAALLKAVKNVKNKRLQRLYKAVITDKTPCRFAGSVTEIQCGSSTMTISSKPSLTALGMTIFSQDGFAGFTGNFKISSGWSYDQALESLKNTTKYKKMAEEVSKYTDSLESKGKAGEAVMIKKLAWNSAKSGKVSLALARLIPGF